MSRFDCKAVGGVTDLYRHFDADGHLLYVGISINALARLTRHRARSGWFAEIATIAVEKFPTRIAALAAESKAIATERPIHNISGRYVPVAEDYDEAEEMAKLELWLQSSSQKQSLN